MSDRLPLPSHVSEATRKLNPHLFAQGSPALPPASVGTTKPKKVNGKGRQPNKTEQRFLDLCDARKRRGEIVSFAFEPITFKLAPDCRYSPDIMVVESPEHILFVEVKGGGPIRDDARVKFLVAREAFPFFSWEMWRFIKGSWEQIF